jgi:hypothetical protein
MKKSTMLIAVFLLWAAISVQAQTNQTGIKNQLAQQSEKTDLAAGKKMQQQSLLKHQPAVLVDTTIAIKTKAIKKATKKKTKRS